MAGRQLLKTTLPFPAQAQRAGLLLAMVLLLAPALTLAQAYRWTDENGKTHFSDKPPADTAVPSEEIEVKGPSPIGQGPEVKAIRERTRRLREAEQEERKKEQEQVARQEAEKARMEKLCKAARRDLRILQGPVKYRDEEGNLYDVSEERVEADRQKARQWIEKHCS